MADVEKSLAEKWAEKTFFITLAFTVAFGMAMAYFIWK